jgi:hypothetical protein
MESGIGSIMSGLYNLYGTNDPYSSAMPYYDKIPGMLNQEYSPWINGGKSALPQLQQYMGRGNSAGGELMNQYSQMTNNPSGLINRLGAGFKESPGYSFQTSQALNAANRASAAGGMAGSPEEQQNIATTTNQLANQDYYNYLNHSQQLYGQGIEGLQKTEGLGAMVGSDLYNTGASSANSLANNLGAAYMNQGNLRFSDTQYNNQRKGQAYGQMWGGINDIFNPGDSMRGGNGFSTAGGGGGTSGGGGGGGGGSIFSSLGSMFGGSGGSGGSSGQSAGSSGSSGSSGGSSSGMNMGEMAGLAELAMMLF